MCDDYVVIVAITDNELVLMQRQYKPGAKKICCGFPAGFKKNDETFLSTAKRELFEETGYKAHKWNHLGTFYDNVSVTSAKFAIYLAKNLSHTEYFANPDKNESEIENMKLPIGEIKSLKMEGACMALAKEFLLKLKKHREISK